MNARFGRDSLEISGEIRLKHSLFFTLSYAESMTYDSFLNGEFLRVQKEIKIFERLKELEDLSYEDFYHLLEGCKHKFDCITTISDKFDLGLDEAEMWFNLFSDIEDNTPNEINFQLQGLHLYLKFLNDYKVLMKEIKGINFEYNHGKHVMRRVKESDDT